MKNRREFFLSMPNQKNLLNLLMAKDREFRIELFNLNNCSQEQRKIHGKKRFAFFGEATNENIHEADKTKYFIDEENEYESDIYDERSIGIHVRNENHIPRIYQTNEEHLGDDIVAIARVVLGDENNQNNSFPAQEFSEYFLQQPKVPVKKIGEGSRLYADRDARHTGPHLWAIKGIIRACYENDLTHIHVLMEEQFLYYCKAIGLDFHKNSSTILAHGKKRIDTFTEIAPLMEKLHAKNYPLWCILSDGGKIYPSEKCKLQPENLTKSIHQYPCQWILFNRLGPKEVTEKIMSEMQNLSRSAL